MGGVESPLRYNLAFELPLRASDERLEPHRVDVGGYKRKSRVSLMDDATIIVKGRRRMQVELQTLYDDLLRLNGVMHPDKCLTATMKRGSLGGAQERLSLRTWEGKSVDVPTIADERLTKFLGAVYGASAKEVGDSLVETLKTELTRIDEVNIKPGFKLCIYEDYLLPAWKYRLAVQPELATRKRELRQLEAVATKFLKKWARLPQSVTRAALYGEGGMRLTPFAREAVATACEVIEQAAKGDVELRRALAREVMKEDKTREGFNPTAVAFAVWTGARADMTSTMADGSTKERIATRVKELDAAARKCVVQ